MGEFVLSPKLRSSSENDEQESGVIFSAGLIKDAGVLWFCRLRLIVIALFLTLWAMGQNKTILEFLNMNIGNWPLICALLLIANNIIFYWHFKLKGTSYKHSKLNLIAQIFSDLLILTAVVHFVGSTSTFVSFAYLFHIVLTCIFFSRNTSLAVLCFSALLFSICVTAEYTGIIEKREIFLEYDIPSKKMAFVNTISAILHWFVIWYLVDHLASIVKRLDKKLSKANHKLALSQKEKLQHMLTMAHQLKTPVSAIHSQAQLLLEGFCGDLPDKAVRVAKKISIRCLSVSNEIKDMLLLASVSYNQKSEEKQKISLSDAVKNSISQLSAICEKRKIHIKTQIDDEIYVKINHEHLVLLLSNIITNAVNYSYDNSEVIVNCFKNDSGSPVLKIQDFGIGIPEDKLPQIFEQYFRTYEAKTHNPNSSGLGLAIVKEIAERYGITIKIESSLGHGTTFTIEFPAMDTTKRLAL